jgi:hypothetical protein
LSWGSIVGIATCYGLHESQWGQDFLHPSTPALELTQPPVQWLSRLFSAPIIHTSPGAHPASCTMAITSISWGYSSWPVALTTHPHLASWLEKE